MPYLLMVKSYDYDDEHYTGQDGGYPKLVFGDSQYLEALGMLDAHRQEEWRSCTPLESYYREEPLSDFSSSDLGDAALAAGISGILGKLLSVQDILGTDFQTLQLSEEQQRLIGLMLGQVGHSYLEFVKPYRKD